MLCAAFSASIFWLDEIGKKAFDKMLMKLKDIALINFSSGTTGSPKAIPSSHKMIWDRANSDGKPNR